MLAKEKVKAEYNPFSQMYFLTIVKEVVSWIAHASVNCVPVYERICVDV